MKKLYRSEKDKKVAGIFGGMGEVYGMDATLLRVVFLFLFVLTGIFPFGLFYILAWIIIPSEHEIHHS